MEPWDIFLVSMIAGALCVFIGAVAYELGRRR